MSKRGTVIIDDPEQEFASASTRSGPPQRSSSRTSAKLRQGYTDDFADDFGDDPSKDEPRPRPVPRQLGLKFRLKARVPKSLAGRIATGVAMLGILGVGVTLLMYTRRFLLHDSRFMIATPASIELQGNKHLTRAQMVDIFGEDVGRNIFQISLEDRQAQLEQLPWVAHATVMRLLPGRIRISLIERVPVAFVRQGSHIGLVDNTGVLLDMKPASPGSQEPHYSFPVVTGISATDPASTREARMKIFERFATDLDSSGEKISEKLSEVDLSNPEDVKALIPDQAGEILIHFGDDQFLERYRKFKEHLPEWRTQYPNLSSVDMRYEREVVLDMAGSKGAAIDAPAPSAKSVALAATPAHVPAHLPAHAPAKPVVKAKAKPVAHPAPKPHAGQPVAKTQAPVVAHPTAVVTPAASTPAAPSASAAARSGYPAKPAAGKTPQSDQYHPPQVPIR